MLHASKEGRRSKAPKKDSPKSNSSLGRYLIYQVLILCRLGGRVHCSGQFFFKPKERLVPKKTMRNVLNLSLPSHPVFRQEAKSEGGKQTFPSPRLFPGCPMMVQPSPTHT